MNVNPNPVGAVSGVHNDGDAPEIRKYKKKFSGDVSVCILFFYATYKVPNVFEGNCYIFVFLDTLRSFMGSKFAYWNRFRSYVVRPQWSGQRYKTEFLTCFIFSLNLL